MHLIRIPQGSVAGLWPVAAPLLARAVAYTDGATSLEKERHALLCGDKQLWIVVSPDGARRNEALAAGITSLQRNEDGGLTANIELFGGDNMKAWFALKQDFEAWARQAGCRDVRLWARKGWARHLPDFRLTHYILRKELT